MKNKTIVSTLLISAVLVACSGSVFAGEVDVLIEKLVEKKILTESEAKDVVKDVKEESKKSPTSWTDKVKIKGDVRFRYQTEDKDSSSVSRERYRVRGRLGIIGKPVDKWEAGIGLATGGSDPRSTNETLDSAFDTPDIRMDYAYVKFSPNNIFSIMGGKIKNPIWGTKDLLWDSDINPEGIAANFNFKVNDNLEIFTTPGYFIIDEIKGSKDDPVVFFIQPGVNWKVSNLVSLKMAAAYYDFSNIAGNDFSEYTDGNNSADTVTTPAVIDDLYDIYIPESTTTTWLYDYQAITLDAELGFKLPGDFYIKVFGQFVDSDTDIDNTGYLYGIKVGDKSLSFLNSWEFKVNMRELENDAWPCFLSDSDFYGGETGVDGMELELKLGLTKNVTFALDFYKTDLIEGDNEQDILQADLVVKF